MIYICSKCLIFTYNKQGYQNNVSLLKNTFFEIVRGGYKMPRGIHQLEVDIPIERVWSFVSDIDKWAPLVPGYMEHKVLNENQSTWKFKGDLGFVQKTVNLKIDITKWQKPTKITFHLTGLDENFTGKGFFEAQSLGKQMTKVTGSLDITAKGMMGPMINSVLKSFVPKTTKEFTESVAEKMVEIETVTT